LVCRGARSSAADFERGGGIGVEPGDRLEDGAQLGQADRTRTQRLERGGMPAGRRRVGDQRAGGALGHHQRGRELGEERSGGELTLRRRGTGVHRLDRMARSRAHRSTSRNCSACAARMARSSATIRSRPACNARAALVASGVVMDPFHTAQPPTFKRDRNTS
jgi:hypothetical protein